MCELATADMQYFRMAFTEGGESATWLDRHKRLCDYDLPKTDNGMDILLYYAIRFYPYSWESLSDAKAVLLCFNDVKLQFLKGYLEMSVDDYCTCCACLILISGRAMSRTAIAEAAQSFVASSIALLRCFEASTDEIITKVIECVRAHNCRNAVELLATFLSIAQRSATFGGHYYNVVDKTGHEWTISLSRKGLLQFEPSDLCHPKKIYLWDQLGNFSCKERTFAVDVQLASGSQTPPTSLRGRPKITNSFHTTESSPACNRAAQCVTYICHSEHLCKSLWSAAVEQHQFILNEGTSATLTEDGKQQRIRVLQAELAELLANGYEPFIRSDSSGSLASPHPSSSRMPSAKVSDGYACRNAPTSSCKGQMDRQRNIDLFKKLKERRISLEDRLLDKLEELKGVCISEAELTGELPKEIYRTLLPGEPEPKVKKRVGTSFKIPDELLNQTADNNDHEGKLEADIALHRKIVAAAEKLAKDKTTNKSVRKKRRKDLQAAAQRLKGLEKESWTNFSGNSLKSATKSCPVTPRGSVPDLTDTPDGRIRLNFSGTPSSPTDALHQASISSSSGVSSGSLSAQSSGSHIVNDFVGKADSAGLPPVIPDRRPSATLRSSISAEAQKLRQANGRRRSEDPPLYANVGYTTSVPYKSEYRQSNFPTLQDRHLLSRANTTVDDSFHLLEPTEPTSSERCTTNFGIKKFDTSSHFGVDSRCHTPEKSSQFNGLLNRLDTLRQRDRSPATSSDNWHRSSDPNDSNAASWQSRPSASTTGYSTTSLDRRTLRRRLAYDAAGKDANGNAINRTAASAQLTTTFPVNEPRTNDFIRSTASATTLRPTKLSEFPSSSSSSRLMPTWRADPRMEALLASIHKRAPAVSVTARSLRIAARDSAHENRNANATTLV
ncbi:GRP1 binding protein [Aphelenchoides avenae]|nr:GRP1 binding protein [Aphelenchus avenae]